ncbi:hypothetical protein VS868_01170 [Salinimicrobium sp. 3283s]|uniref:hypothetical protein n=1 Tax=Salinimicrobium sp. 3283s TaxID=3114359 RepID=UPI0031EE01FF
MKKVMYWLFLIPFMAMAQNPEQGNQQYAVFENAVLTPQPDKVQQFEEGIAAHNKKFHASDPYGARVYYISNGPNVGKYMWVMGPLPWSAMDNRPEDKAHDDDWINNVVKYMTPDSDQSYWRFNNELSNFPKDFKVNKLLVDTYDIKRFKDEGAKASMEKVAKVMKGKYPDMAYGVYTNELPATKDGRDLSMVFFFDDMAWMGEDPKFVKAYEEMYGANSWKSFMQEWEQSTDGKQSELWIFEPELSGLSADVKAMDRQ